MKKNFKDFPEHIKIKIKFTAFLFGTWEKNKGIVIEAD
jgi:hypothetical protein